MLRQLFNHRYTVTLVSSVILILTSCTFTISPEQAGKSILHQLTAGESTELVFTSGIEETGRQSVVLQIDQPGSYTMVLENANPTWSGHWIIWDYIALRTEEEILWAIGEDEAPPTYEDMAFTEFCNPGADVECLTEYTVGITKTEEFLKELNDGVSPTAKIHFTLAEEAQVTEYTLDLSTLYSTHEGAKSFRMKVLFTQS